MFFSILGLLGLRKVSIIVHSHNNAVKKMWLHRLCRPLLNVLTTHRLACSEEAGAFMFGKSNVRKGRVKVIKNAIDCKRFQFDEVKRERVRSMLGISKRYLCCCDM